MAEVFINTTDILPLDPYPKSEQYEKEAEELAAAKELSLSDAQLAVARQYGFDNWILFMQFIREFNRKNSSVSQFESAVDAIVSGDVQALRSLLRANPALTRLRSMRVHRAMLLHYVAGNGVENYRQKTPANAVEIVKLLLNNGAEVDAESTSGSTTLGLVATSIHPKLAGLQIQLLELLLDNGAAVDGIPGEWNPLQAALCNGRPEAALYLAQRGARLDLEGAAGTGKLDIVKTYFNTDGNLEDTATRKQMESGFMWACEYGYNDVVEFLLDKGMNIQTGENTDMTGLHWAIVGAQPATIRLLLKRGASLKALNVYGGDALRQALWAITNTHYEKDFIPVIELLLEAGAVVEPGYLTWWLKQERLLPTTKQYVEGLLSKYGGN